LLLFSLPDFVTFSRLAVARCVLIFGIHPSLIIFGKGGVPPS
jgi:hypothetical protein